MLVRFLEEFARFWKNRAQGVQSQRRIWSFSFQSKCKDEFSAFRSTRVLRWRRCTAYYTALVSHAMRHRNRVQDTSRQSQGENWRVRIADIVNTPVKPRVCESRMRAWCNVERGLTRLISRDVERRGCWWIFWYRRYIVTSLYCPYFTASIS